MVTALPNLIQPFVGRAAGLGRVYVQKDRLALVNGNKSTIAVDEDQMCASFCISDNTPDRVGDVVVPMGIDLTHFRNNPIGFFAHQGYIWPIGRWEDDDGRCTIQLERDRALGTIYFFKDRKTEAGMMALQTFLLVKQKILRSCSIGFNPIAEPVPRSPSEDNPNSLQSGYLFPRVDLLEVSVVGIPANPTATLVREILSQNNLAGAAILPPIRKSLLGMAEPAPAWSNGATLPPEEPMSKKWGKKKPAAKLALPVVKAKPTATKALAKPSLEECVTKKVGKLIDDGMPHAEALAAAFAECGDDKAMGESSGTAGGYTVNGEHDDEENKALTAAIISLTERVDKAATAARKRKKLPPPPGTPDAELPGDEAGDQQQEQPPPPQPQQQVQPNPKGDPREVLTQLVDALTAYLDLTTAKPEAPMEEEEDEEEEDEEEDNDNQDVEEGDTEADQTTGDERYQFRTATPKRQKAAKGEDEDPAMNTKRCKAVCKAAAKHLKEMGDMDDDAPIKSMHKAASHYHRKELEGLVKDMGDEGEDETVAESEDDGESSTPAAPVNKRGQKALVEEESIDLTQILKALQPVEERVVAVGNAWANLNGTMP